MRGTENRIVIEPDICNGRPIVRGTRMSVQTILEFLGAGDTIEEILAAYPDLAKGDILAAVRYAAQRIADQRVYSANTR